MSGYNVLRFFVRNSSTKIQDLRIANEISYAPYKTWKYDTKERQINIEGQTLNYIKVGNGPKHIFFLAGMVGTIWSDFKPQIESFDRNKFTIVAWDPPGYGRSRPQDKQLNPDFYEVDAHFAQKLMEVLNIPKYSLLGWSDGGVTSLFVAAKHPEKVEKLVVWGTGTYISQNEQKYIESIKDLSMWPKKTKEPLIEFYTEKVLQEILNRYSNAFQIMYDNGKDICSGLLKDIRCPTFILHGDKDHLLALEHPLYLLKNIERSRLYRFINGKHNIHLKYPDEFNKLVSNFLLE